MPTPIVSESSQSPTPEGYHLEIIPDFTSASPHAREVIALNVRAINYDGDDRYEISDEEIADETEHMSGVAFVALVGKDNKVAAVAGLEKSPDSKEQGSVVGVVTSPEHRREGLGRVVVSEVIKLAASKGIKGLSLTSTHDAEEFYTKLGFIPSKQTPWEFTKTLE